MKQKKLLPYLFMLPALVSLLLIYLIPFIYSIAISMTDWTGIGFKIKFLGLKNYIDIILDKNFTTVLKNTLVYFVELVGIQFLVSLLLAVLVNGKFKGSKFFETVFFLPTVVCTVAVGFIWNVMFDTMNGPIKTFLTGLVLNHWLIYTGSAIRGPLFTA